MTDFDLEQRYSEASELIQKFYRQADQHYNPERHPLKIPKDRFLDDLLRAGEMQDYRDYFMTVGRGLNRPDIVDFFSLMDLYRSFFEPELTTVDLEDEY